jgi:CheY-like chemotaxis protein
MDAAKEHTGKRKRASLVLVVEDDPDFREMVRLTLASAGYTVAEASDGAEAMRYLVATGAPEPNVIVLDVQMPNMSGPELMKVMKSCRRLQQIPVILTSSLARAADIDMETAWLPKPFEAARLIELVRDMCMTRTPLAGKMPD